MSPKQCLTHGHRWGKPMIYAARGIWVELRVCQRKACDRLRGEDDTGRVMTYQQNGEGAPIRVKTIRSGHLR